MIYDIALPLLVAIAPWIIVRYVFTSASSRKISYRAAIPYLWSAAVVWEIGIRLWEMGIRVSIINGQLETDTLALHTIGGIAACILFYFVIKVYRLHFAERWYKPVALFFFVSGLGVTNELFELFLNQTHILVVTMHPNDTWWDLTANSLGAMIAYGCMSLYGHFKSTKNQN